LALDTALYQNLVKYTSVRVCHTTIIVRHFQPAYTSDMHERIVVVEHSSKETLIITLGGVIVGAIFGAVATYILAKIERNKANERAEVRELRLKIRAHQAAFSEGNAVVTGTLVLAIKNVGHLKDLAKGILDGTNFRGTISLPQPYPSKSGLATNIVNGEFTAHMQSYENEIVLQNCNITELKDYYIPLRNLAHESLLMNKSLRGDVIAVDNATVVSAANDNLKATKLLIERCCHLLAMMDLHAEQWETIDFMTITLLDMNKYFEVQRTYKPNAKKLKKHTDELLQDATAEKMFKSEQFSDAVRSK
jgi:hypothetical protein